jgi:hypothetical protein
VRINGHRRTEHEQGRIAKRDAPFVERGTAAGIPALQRLYQRNGELVTDETAEVIISDEGAYVEAWVWTPQLEDKIDVCDARQ